MSALNTSTCRAKCSSSIRAGSILGSTVISWGVLRVSFSGSLEGSPGGRRLFRRHAHRRPVHPCAGLHLRVGIDREIDVQSSMEELDWLREHGVVMQSARGPVPSLAERVAGGPIRGSWWGHPSGHEIYRVLNEVRASPDVVATRLIMGRSPCIHRRLWPALVRVADRFPSDRLAAIDEVHTGSGAQQTIAVPFPDWVPAEGPDRPRIC